MAKFFNKKIILITTCILITFLSIGGAYVVQRFINHERWQQARIESLTGSIAYLEERLNQNVDYYNYDMQYKYNAYNYLAIGNSLTLIKEWGRGICSTEVDNDYFGLVVTHLKQKREVVARRFNFFAWEKMLDRDKALVLLTPFLDNKLNLVTIQVGENVSNLTTYQQDLVKLVRHIKVQAPKAQVIIVGDFWSKGKNDMRRQAALDSKSGFADLEKIIGDKNYWSRVGVVCSLGDGKTIQVSEMAASHPGDKGMRYIADRVIEQLHK